MDVPVTSEPSDYIMIAGIPVTPGPRIILCPAFGISKEEYRKKINGPMKISQRSSLILDGHHINIKNLAVDGALVIRAASHSYVTIDGLNVQNAGWVLNELDPTVEYPEEVRIRGYTMEKIETAEYIIHEPGSYIIDSTGEVRKVE